MFLLPAVAVFLKHLRQAAPTDVTGEGFLLLACGRAPFRLNLFENANGGDVVAILGLWPALTEMIVGDVVANVALFAFA